MWRGEKAQYSAYEQLLGYMNTKHMDEGYLLVFDLRKGENKEQRAAWVEVGNGKRIFEVIV